MPENKKAEELAVTKPLDPSKRYTVNVRLQINELGPDGAEKPFFNGMSDYPNCPMDVVVAIEGELIEAQRRLHEIDKARVANAVNANAAKKS